MRKAKFKVASTTVRVASNTLRQVEHLSKSLDDGYTLYAEAIAVIDGVVKQFRVTYTAEGVIIGDVSDRPALGEPISAIEGMETSQPEPLVSAAAISMADLPDDWLGVELGKPTDLTTATSELERDFELNYRTYQPQARLLEQQAIEEDGILEPIAATTMFVVGRVSGLREQSHQQEQQDRQDNPIAGVTRNDEPIAQTLEEPLDEAKIKAIVALAPLDEADLQDEDLLIEALDYLLQQMDGVEMADGDEAIEGLECTAAFEQAFEEAVRNGATETNTAYKPEGGCYQDQVAAQVAVEQYNAELMGFTHRLFQAWKGLSHEIWGQPVSIDLIYEMLPYLTATAFLDQLATLNAKASLVEGIRLHLSDRPTEGDLHAVGGRLCSGLSFSRVLRSQPKTQNPTALHGAREIETAQSNPPASSFQPISHPPVTPLGQLVQQLSQPATEQDLAFIDRLRRHSFGDTGSVQKPEEEALRAGETSGTRKRFVPWLR